MCTSVSARSHRSLLRSLQSPDFCFLIFKCCMFYRKVHVLWLEYRIMERTPIILMTGQESIMCKCNSLSCPLLYRSVKWKLTILRFIFHCQGVIESFNVNTNNWVKWLVHCYWIIARNVMCSTITYEWIKVFPVMYTRDWSGWEAVTYLRLCHSFS